MSKLIEIFDSAGFVKEEPNSVWEEVNKHYLTMKTLLNKFDKNESHKVFNMRSFNFS